LESAKVGALMLLEAFVKEGFFGQDEVKQFMSEHFSSFAEERLFKIRRPFLKCLITVSKHLSLEEISTHVFSVFKVYSQLSEVWGLRRYCLELAPDLVQLLNPTDLPALRYVLEFLQNSLTKQ
jgi:hypothetical protein